MTKQSMPAVSSVNEENLEDFKTLDKIVIVGYVASDDKSANKSFTAFAESQRDNYLFGATNDAALAKAEDVKQPSIVLYKDFDEKKAVYDGEFEDEAISKWIQIASTPLVGELGPETYSKYMAVCYIKMQACYVTVKRLISTHLFRPGFLWLTFLPRLRKSARNSPRTSARLLKSTVVRLTSSPLTRRLSGPTPAI